MTILATLAALVSVCQQGSDPVSRADAILTKLGMARTLPLKFGEYPMANIEAKLGPLIQVVSNELSIVLPVNSACPYTMSNNRRYQSMRSGNYDWSKPLLPQDTLASRLRAIPALLGMPLEVGHYEVRYTADNRNPLTIQAAFAAFAGFPRYQGVEVAGAIFGFRIDQRTGELIDLQAIVDFRFSPPLNTISPEEARRRNGLVWNNPGSPPEPKVKWYCPSGEWGAPDWRGDLPRRLRKAYLFHADGANLWVDLEDGRLLGGSTRQYGRNDGTKPAPVPLLTWTKSRKTSPESRCLAPSRPGPS